MKLKRFMNWSLVLLSLSLVAGCSAEAEPANSENYGKLDIPVETISLGEVTEDFSYYDLAVQKELQQQLNTLKEKQAYTFKEPLLVINPFGTNTTGLYLYFEEENPGSLTYTISAEETSDFTRTAKDANSIGNRAEYQLIGLVPGVENRISVTYTYDNGAKKAYEFTLTAPPTQSGYPAIEKTEQTADAKLSDGLFYTLGTDGFAGYSYVFDNDGTLRAELVTEDYRTDRMEFYKGSIVTAISDSQIARIDRLGKVVAVYDLKGFQMHHDFALNGQGQLLILATELAKDSVEDVVLILDLETGKYEKLIDFDNLMGSYREMTVSKGDLDWLHFNSIDLAGEDTMLLSSRETSTLIQISGIYDEPEIDYLLGNESVWADTEFADKSLSRTGDFEYQSGQHTATYMEDPSLLDGQYYVYMFQNNYWRYSSRPDYEGLTNTKASLTWETNNKDISKFYKYLVDEHAGTYHLVQEFAVPYSSIVSSTQIYGDSIIVNSGMAKVVGEYDSKGNLLAQFSYEADLFTYRIFKDTFKGFWFE